MKKIFYLLLIISLLFFKTGTAQVLEGFENWTNYTVAFTVQLEEPNGWSGTDSIIVGFGKLLDPFGSFQKQIFKESPGNSGSFAMKAATKPQDAIGAANLPAKDYPVSITNSNISIDIANQSFTQSGGTPINTRAISTSMFVKNTVIGGDTTYIQAILIDNSDGADSIVAIADTALGVNISSYTKLTLPFTYNGSTLIPSVVRYVISSGNLASVFDSTNTFVVHDGTEIIVDDIDIQAPLGVTDLLFSSKVANVYPTHFQDLLHIDFLEEKHALMSVHIFDLNGRVLKEEALSDNQNALDLSFLASGNYLFQIKDKLGQLVQYGKLIK